jgi:hypothetical protein
MRSGFRSTGFGLRSILVLSLVACTVGADRPVFAGTPPPTHSLAFDIPPYTGQTYTDRVPATLDLAEMARLSLNALTQPVDPAQNYSLYFVASWNQNPPVLRHEAGSDDCLGKFIGPQVLNRLVSGSDEYLDFERRILEHAYLSDPQGRVLGRNGASARVFEGFMLRYLRDHNPMWKDLVQQTLQGWVDTLDCPPGTNYGYWQNEGTPFSAGVWSQNPWKDELLLMAYREFNWPAALEAARKHINFVVHHCDYFDWDSGRFLGYHEKPTDARVHFHMHALYLKTFLQCGLLTKDADLVRFVKRSYLWARSPQAGSAPALGFFPEFANQSANSEGCAISDMVDLALMMSEAGVDDFWDDADRWIRNHFAECQLSPEKAARLQAWAMTRPSQQVQPNESSDRTTERSVGAFAGWPGVNDWHPIWRAIQHCCTGNASRSIFYAWDCILDESGKGLIVNLLLNRAARKADLYSYLPYEGRVELHVKQNCDFLRVRMSDYVAANSVRCTVNGSSRHLRFSGRFAEVGKVKVGARVKLLFANPTTTIVEQVMGKSYTCTERGHTVVAIDPPGAHCPLYERGAMKADAAPRVNVTRFVSDETNVLQRIPAAPRAFAGRSLKGSGG